MKPTSFFLIFFFSTLNLHASVKKNVNAPSDSTLKLKVYIFLSETCPMSQSYIPVLNQLSKNYQDKGVEWIGVFPNFYVTDSIIQTFIKAYEVGFKVVRDSGFILTNRFNARLTPEIFITDATKTVHYRGAIDNAYFRAGKRRGNISQHYLKNALDSLLNNQKIEISTTEVFGCVIVRD